MIRPIFQGPAAPGRLHALASVALAVLLTLAGALVLDTVSSVALLHTPLPFFDEWDNLGIYKALVHGAAPLSAFLWPNNEHRILFPRWCCTRTTCSSAAAERSISRRSWRFRSPRPRC